MKKIVPFVLMAMIMGACNMPAATPVPQFETPVVFPTNTASAGGTVTLNNVSFTIPLGVAKDSQSEMVSAVSDANNAAPFELAPAHLEFTLTGYQLQNKLLEPQIFVYPAEEYAKLNPIAGEQIQKVKTIIAGSQLTSETMPVVPSFNATQQIASKMQVINFQNGRGIRFLTQYAQYPSSINNHELFYHFQGLTNDGKYYVVAALPVSSSILAEDEKPESSLPPGGVPFPTGGGPTRHTMMPSPRHWMPCMKIRLTRRSSNWML